MLMIEDGLVVAKLQLHPVADIFPPMSEAEYGALKTDIRENGQLEPVWTWRGHIVDGRHRAQACQELGIAVKSHEWDGEEHELTRFVISMNLHRRHLNESQRAMIGAKLATLELGQRADLAKKSQEPDKTTSSLSCKEAGQLLNVSAETVLGARSILRHGSAEDIAAIEQGRARVTPIAKRLPKQTKFIGKKESRRGIRKYKDAPYNAETKGQVQRAEAQKNKMVSSLSIVTGHCRGLEELDVPMALSVCTKEEIKVWIGKAREASRAFRKFAGKLEQGMKHVN
jgi:ParB-like chromosome segregation protein Spo0J